MCVLSATKTTKASQAVSVTKSMPADSGEVRGMDLIPGLGRSPGGGMVTHSDILAWRIPWTEKPDRLQSIRLQRVRHD